MRERVRYIGGGEKRGKGMSVTKRMSKGGGEGGPIRYIVRWEGGRAKGRGRGRLRGVSDEEGKEGGRDYLFAPVAGGSEFAHDDFHSATTILKFEF